MSVSILIFPNRNVRARNDHEEHYDAIGCCFDFPKVIVVEEYIKYNFLFSCGVICYTAECRGNLFCLCSSIWGVCSIYKDKRALHLTNA